jgi:hypothetical protein
MAGLSVGGFVADGCDEEQATGFHRRVGGVGGERNESINIIVDIKFYW